MILRAAAALLLAMPATAPAAEEPAEPAEPDFAGQSRELEERIAALSAVDPLQPETLEARLAYARLLHDASVEDCLPLIDAAEEQLAPILSAGEADLLAWPDGLPDAMSLLLSIQNTRGQCAEDEPSSRAAFAAAIATGERAVALLRDNWDFEEMSIAGYNLAFARRASGDLDGALDDLEQVLDWDQEFGLRDELATDYETYLRWAGGGEEPDPAEVARFAASFNQIKARLNFAPSTHRARWQYEAERAKLQGGRLQRAVARYRSEVTMRPEGEDWILSTRLLGEPTIEIPDQAGPRNSRALADVVQELAAVVPDMVVGADGSFKELRNLAQYRERLVGEMRRMMRELAPAGLAPPGDDVLEPVLQSVLKPELLGAEAAGDWNVAVGTWVDGEFDHGDWYSATFEEPLPGLPPRPVEMTWDFKVSRWLPCVAGGEARCVELLLRISPDPEDVRAVVAEFVAPMVPAARRAEVEDVLRATAYRLDMRYRIVTDPDTLRPWSVEERTYVYGAGLDAGRRQVAAQREQNRATAEYPD